MTTWIKAKRGPGNGSLGHTTYLNVAHIVAADFLEEEGRYKLATVNGGVAYAGRDVLPLLGITSEGAAQPPAVPDPPRGAPAWMRT